MNKRKVFKKFQNPKHNQKGHFFQQKIKNALNKKCRLNISGYIEND